MDDTYLIPARAIPPGQILGMELEARGWTQKDLAEIIGRPYQAVNEIIRGKKRITPETARELAQAFGTSPELWMNLEADYRLQISEQSTKEEHIARRSKLFSKLPLTEIFKRGWIEKTSDLDDLEKRVCSFLGIASIDAMPVPVVKYRQSVRSEPEIISELAWLKRVEYLTSQQSVKDFKRSKLEKAIPALLEHSLRAEDVAQVPEFLLDLGIHFIIVPHLKKTYLDGAYFVYDSHPVLALTLRYDRIDSFWFTLMHELAHVILDHQEHLDDLYSEDRESDAEEEEANTWARKTLIDEERLNLFIKQIRPYFSKEKIIDFAHDLNRHPGIVLGRLQFREEVSYQNLRNLLNKVSPYLEGWIDQPTL